jgi:hypothetical protein
MTGYKGFKVTTGWSALGAQTQSPYVVGGFKDGDKLLGHSVCSIYRRCLPFWESHLSNARNTNAATSYDRLPAAHHLEARLGSLPALQPWQWPRRQMDPLSNRPAEQLYMD